MKHLAARHVRTAILAIMLTSAVTLSTYGQAPASAIAQANSGTVGVVSGGVDGTYIRIATDLAAVLDEGDQLRILPIAGKGSLQNVADILYLRGIDLGIVQSDVLA